MTAEGGVLAFDQRLDAGREDKDEGHREFAYVALGRTSVAT